MACQAEKSEGRCFEPGCTIKHKGGRFVSVAECCSSSDFFPCLLRAHPPLHGPGSRWATEGEDASTMASLCSSTANRLSLMHKAELEQHGPDCVLSPLCVLHLRKLLKDLWRPSKRWDDNASAIAGGARNLLEQLVRDLLKMPEVLAFAIKPKQQDKQGSGSKVGKPGHPDEAGSTAKAPGKATPESTNLGADASACKGAGNAGPGNILTCDSALKLPKMTFKQMCDAVDAWVQAQLELKQRPPTYTKLCLMAWSIASEGCGLHGRVSQEPRFWDLGNNLLFLCNAVVLACDNYRRCCELRFDCNKSSFKAQTIYQSCPTDQEHAFLSKLKEELEVEEEGDKELQKNVSKKLKKLEQDKQMALNAKDVDALYNACSSIALHVYQNISFNRAQGSNALVQRLHDAIEASLIYSSKFVERHRLFHVVIFIRDQASFYKKVLTQISQLALLIADRAAGLADVDQQNLRALADQLEERKTGTTEVEQLFEKLMGYRPQVFNAALQVRSRHSEHAELSKPMLVEELQAGAGIDQDKASKEVDYALALLRAYEATGNHMHIFHPDIKAMWYRSPLYQEDTLEFEPVEWRVFLLAFPNSLPIATSKIEMMRSWLDAGKHLLQAGMHARSVNRKLTAAFEEDLKLTLDDLNGTFYDDSAGVEDLMKECMDKAAREYIPDPPTPPADDQLPSHRRRFVASALDKHEQNLAQQALHVMKSQPLLLSGAPGAGKSTLGKRIMEESGAACFLKVDMIAASSSERGLLLALCSTLELEAEDYQEDEGSLADGDQEQTRLDKLKEAIICLLADKAEELAEDRQTSGSPSVALFLDTCEIPLQAGGAVQDTLLSVLSKILELQLPGVQLLLASHPGPAAELQAILPSLYKLDVAALEDAASVELVECVLARTCTVVPQEEALELVHACGGNPLKICVCAPALVSGKQNKQDLLDLAANTDAYGLLLQLLPSAELKDQLLGLSMFSGSFSTQQAEQLLGCGILDTEQALKWLHSRGLVAQLSPSLWAIHGSVRSAVCSLDPDRALHMHTHFATYIISQLLECARTAGRRWVPSVRSWCTKHQGDIRSALSSAATSRDACIGIAQYLLQKGLEDDEVPLERLLSMMPSVLSMGDLPDLLLPLLQLLYEAAAASHDALPRSLPAMPPTQKLGELLRRSSQIVICLDHQGAPFFKIEGTASADQASHIPPDAQLPAAQLPAHQASHIAPAAQDASAQLLAHQALHVPPDTQDASAQLPAHQASHVPPDAQLPAAQLPAYQASHIVPAAQDASAQLPAIHASHMPSDRQDVHQAAHPPPDHQDAAAQLPAHQAIHMPPDQEDALLFELFDGISQLYGQLLFKRNQVAGIDVLRRACETIEQRGVLAARPETPIRYLFVHKKQGRTQATDELLRKLQSVQDSMEEYAQLRLPMFGTHIGASDAVLGRQMEYVDRARRVANECTDPWLAPRYIINLVSWLCDLANRFKLRGELKEAAAAAKEAHELSAKWLGADAVSTRRMSLVHLLLLLHLEQARAQLRVRSDCDVAELKRQGWQRSLAELKDKHNQLRPWDTEPLMRTAFLLLLQICIALKKGVAEAVQACEAWLTQGLKLQGPGSNAVLQRTQFVAGKLRGAKAHREALVVVRNVAEAYVAAGLSQAAPTYACLLHEQLVCCPSFQHPDAVTLIDQLDRISEHLGEDAGKEVSAKRWLSTARLRGANKDWEGMEAAYLHVLPTLPSTLGASKTNEILVSLASTYVQKGSITEALSTIQKALGEMASISEIDALSHVKRMAALLQSTKIEDDMWDLLAQKRTVLRQLSTQRHRLIITTAAPNVQKSQLAQVQETMDEANLLLMELSTFSSMSDPEARPVLGSLDGIAARLQGTKQGMQIKHQRWAITASRHEAQCELDAASDAHVELLMTGPSVLGHKEMNAVHLSLAKLSFLKGHITNALSGPAGLGHLLQDDSRFGGAQHLTQADICAISGLLHRINLCQDLSEHGRDLKKQRFVELGKGKWEQRAKMKDKIRKVDESTSAEEDAPSTAAALLEDLSCCALPSSPTTTELMLKLGTVANRMNGPHARRIECERWLQIARMHTEQEEWQQAEAAYLQAVPMLNLLPAQTVNAWLGLSCARSWLQDTRGLLDALGRAVEELKDEEDVHGTLEKIDHGCALLPRLAKDLQDADVLATKKSLCKQLLKFKQSLRGSLPHQCRPTPQSEQGQQECRKRQQKELLEDSHLLLEQLSCCFIGQYSDATSIVEELSSIASNVGGPQGEHIRFKCWYYTAAMHMAHGEWAQADGAFTAALEHSGSEADSADAAECLEGRCRAQACAGNLVGALRSLEAAQDSAHFWRGRTKPLLTHILEQLEHAA